jgi:hypothetical protein
MPFLKKTNRPTRAMITSGTYNNDSNGRKKITAAGSNHAYQFPVKRLLMIFFAPDNY